MNFVSSCKLAVTIEKKNLRDVDKQDAMLRWTPSPIERWF